ncbi:MAG: hypothetical protein CML68_25065 [Rhodobacteraceae bacterium]|nr:hypothetical protein [Paracoccaceae bacterium]
MKLNHMTLGAAAIALMAGGAFAQETTAPAADPALPNTEMQAEPSTDMGTEMGTEAPVLAPEFASMDEMTVGDVVGTVVNGPEGDRIGEIDYVVAQPSGPAGVIGIGGFLGLGEYTVAIALEEFDMAEDGTFTLPMEKDMLKEMPEFDESGVEGLPDDMLISDLMADEGTVPQMDDPMATDEDPVMTN